MRDCLTRVPRTHAITILEKDDSLRRQSNGLSLFLAGKAAEVQKAWSSLDDEDISALKSEHALSLASAYYLFGKALHSETPLPVMGNKISATSSRDLIYFPKPPDFLESLPDHFFLGDLTDRDTIKKTLENPLVIGSIDEH